MAKIHETAIVDPAATIADDVEIGAWSIIGPDVTIGEGCWIGPHVIFFTHSSSLVLLFPFPVYLLLPVYPYLFPLIYFSPLPITSH